MVVWVAFDSNHVLVREVDFDAESAARFARWASAMNNLGLCGSGGCGHDLGLRRDDSRDLDRNKLGAVVGADLIRPKDAFASGKSAPG